MSRRGDSTSALTPALSPRRGGIFRRLTERQRFQWSGEGEQVRWFKKPKEVESCLRSAGWTKCTQLVFHGIGYLQQQENKPVGEGYNSTFAGIITLLPTNLS